MVKEFIVEDFEDLQGLSDEKLIKLLHKAADYESQCWEEYQKARQRCKEIKAAMSPEIVWKQLLTSIPD